MNPFESAIFRFDSYNSKDPNKEIHDGREFPKELLYAQRMSECLERFAPAASEEVRLAARCQHIGRWKIPRDDYPRDRKGYLQWRNKLKEFHADIAGNILRESGYNEDMVERVRFLLLKKDIYHNAGTQLLEDVVCLVFIRFYLSDFSKKHEPSKVVDILKKTLRKMSAEGRSQAEDLPLDPAVRDLLNGAVSS